MTSMKMNSTQRKQANHVSLVWLSSLLHFFGQFFREIEMDGADAA